MTNTNRLDFLLSLFQKKQFSLFDEEALQILAQPLHPLLHAKVLSWYAQSQQQQNNLSDAIHIYEQAIQAAQNAGDDEGALMLKEQHQQLLEQKKAQETTPTNHRSDDPLQAGIAQLQHRNTSRAETLLLSSVAQADEEGDPKSRVLSRLALSRLPSYQSAMIEQALHIAQQEGDMNLVTAVKKTMDQLGQNIPPHIF